MQIYGVGGTITTLAAINLKLKQPTLAKIEGHILTQATVNKLLSFFRDTPLAKRNNITGLDEKRADIILAGTAILFCLMKLLGINRIRVSARGLRYGYLEEIILPRLVRGSTVISGKNRRIQ
jgi:exopolyphosphatase/guanosine-5'-triphosphate,3'-diphosphate pyrophosphatase